MNKNKEKMLLRLLILLLVVVAAVSAVRIISRLNDTYTTKNSEDEEVELDPDPVYDSSGNYINRELILPYPDGSVLHIGVNTEDKTGIYLNPVYEYTEAQIVMSDESTRFAFAFSNLSGIITTGAASGPWTDYPNEKFYYITDRTYDTLVPCSFNDVNDFGIMYQDFDYPYSERGHTEQILMRVIRFPDFQIVATATIEVRYDGSDYSIVAFYNDDVRALDLISDDDCSDLLDDAFELFMSQSMGFTHSYSPEYWASYKDKAIIEYTGSRYYFSRMYTVTGDRLPSGQYSGMHIVAVNLVYPQIGFVTFYAAPRQEVMGLRDVPFEDFEIFAYDPISPFSRSQITIGDWDRAWFFPED